MMLRALIRHHRRALSRAIGLTTGFGLVGALAAAVAAGPASASGSLTQVSDFGSNPGNLAMYSYLPTGLPAGAPLVVALHGCTQSATAYYSDSGWPKYADQWGFALVFPQQSSANNPESCFDWYTPSDDGRGQGEPASIRSSKKTGRRAIRSRTRWRLPTADPR